MLFADVFTEGFFSASAIISAAASDDFVFSIEDDIDGFAATPYGRALANYERMSRSADRFASNPIVVARAIARAVTARRPSARYVTPRITSVALWLSALLPTSVWDWAMRRAGYLTPEALDLSAVPTAVDAPAVKPAPASTRSSEARAGAN
jgi:hypothetical protein